MLAKERARKVRETNKRKENPRGSERAKSSYKSLFLVLKNRSQRQVKKRKKLHRRIPLTILALTLIGLMMAGVVINGMMTRARLAGMKVGIKLLTIPQASLSPESVDLGAMSSPKRFEWMNLDTGAAG